MYLHRSLAIAILANTAVLALPAPFPASNVDKVGSGFGSFIRLFFNLKSREEASVIQDYGSYGEYGSYGSYQNPPPPAPPASTESVISIPVIPSQTTEAVLSIPVITPSTTTTLTVTLEPTTVVPEWATVPISDLSSTITITVPLTDAGWRRFHAIQTAAPTDSVSLERT